MHLGEIGSVLVGAREGAELCILIQVAEKSNADRRPGTADVVFIAGIDSGRFRRIVLANTVRLDHGRMPGEIGDR